MENIQLLAVNQTIIVNVMVAAIVALVAMIVHFLVVRQLVSKQKILERTVTMRNQDLQNANEEMKQKHEEMLSQSEENKIMAEEMYHQGFMLENKNEEIVQKNEQLTKSYQRLEVISDIGQKLTTNLSIDGISDMLFEYINNVVDIQAFGIAVADTVNQELTCKNFIEDGEHRKIFSKSLNDENSLTVYCYKTQKPLFTNDIKKDYNKFIKDLNPVVTEKLARSRIHIPLSTIKKKIGVLIINSYKEDSFSTDDFTHMLTLASYISIALENADAYEQIHRKNLAIGESINYAQSIQGAFLPREEQINRYFQSFVYYKAKDIVSGDFYWFSPLSEGPSKPFKGFFCVADCTGHGVPGALISMIGNNLLDKYINILKESDPATILDHVNKSFQVALKQDETHNNDGMDMALVYIEELSSQKNEEGGNASVGNEPEQLKDNNQNSIINKKYTLTYAGAKLPLVVYHQKEGKLESYKGTRKSIGGLRAKNSKQSFSNLYLELEAGDTLYLFSDGMIDQLSQNRDRFTMNKLLKLFEDIVELPSYTQREQIEKELLKHQRKEKQTDDITLLGIKL
ncbi:MAG: SpoIIE family protein phosphatase [Bacteroidales bacterium]|nr:SpoIIE family protein phosphatase [Bacteroidales bacterium]